MKTIETDDDHLLPSEKELPPMTFRQKIRLNDICLEFSRFIRREAPPEPDPDPMNSPLPRARG
jgi:hypothetical protein